MGKDPLVNYCTICSRKFDKRCQLRAHCEKKHGIDPLTTYCKPCRAHFHTSWKYLRHVMQHYKNYECDKCNKSFKKFRDLLGHVCFPFDEFSRELEDIFNPVLSALDISMIDKPISPPTCIENIILGDKQYANNETLF